eukprot:CAMPEP_0182417758 /NCGR_PEP_ID=MMETSP1167-20130531/2195_1 /TAXON_ID=2988 /ORGANISM="Mallomonas Sp, Strain CCMP3275" /LENGTH=245 /DNA_ID=CAMNT_0024591515 /DNA_START=141 /DNA_END=879 /DNA_ORIENTATION=-
MFDEGKVDGLDVRRIDIPQISELFSTPVFYYEIADWKWWENPKGGQAVTNTESSPVYVVGSFTYGAKLWPACLAISSFLCDDKHLVKDKILLDIGCGVGLASTAASLCGAKKIIATDISPLTLKLVNKAAKEMSINNIECREFDILDDALSLPIADITVFADVLYTPQLARGVARRVAEARARGDWVIVGSGRGRHGRDAFLQELLIQGVPETFNPPSEDIPVALKGVGWKQKDVELLEINRPLS